LRSPLLASPLPPWHRLEYRYVILLLLLHVTELSALLLQVDKQLLARLLFKAFEKICEITDQPDKKYPLGRGLYLRGYRCNADDLVFSGSQLTEFEPG